MLQGWGFDSRLVLLLLSLAAWPARQKQSGKQMAHMVRSPVRSSLRLAGQLPTKSICAHRGSSAGMSCV